MIDWLRSLDGVHYILYGLAFFSTLGVVFSRLKKLPRENKIREYSEATFFAIWVALAVRTTVAEAQSIPSESMVPTFLIGDNLLVTKYNWGYYVPGLKGRIFDFSKPHHGEIVTFLPPLQAFERKNYVKRCVGLPGDTIEVKDKQVWINGVMKDYADAVGLVAQVPETVVEAFRQEKIMETMNTESFAKRLVSGPVKTWYGPYADKGSKYWVHHYQNRFTTYRQILDSKPEMPLISLNKDYLQPEIWGGKGNKDWYGPYTLKENEYWMMGDNRDNSRDSRYFGPVVYEDLRGTPVFRYFPWTHRFGSVE